MRERKAARRKIERLSRYGAMCSTMGSLSMKFCKILVFWEGKSGDSRRQSDREERRLAAGRRRGDFTARKLDEFTVEDNYF
jgi:hypothetical protein